MCNLDLGLAFAVSLWVFMDAMRGMRERAALRTLQRCFRQKKEAKAAIEAEKASEAAKEGVEALASSPDEAVKEGTEAATSLPDEAVKEGTEAATSPPDEVVKEGTDAHATSPDEAEVAEAVASTDEAVKEGTEAATSSSSESVKEESAVDNSLPNVEVPLSPRVTERLNEARNLDAQLNS
jgi:hypothetical protein